MRAKLAALALAIAVALTVAACGGSDNSSSSPSAGAKDLKGQTITYWASNQAPSIPEDYRILKREAAKFTAQSGVKVDIKVIGWPDLFNNITAGYNDQILARRDQTVDRAKFVSEIHQTSCRVIAIDVKRISQDRKSVFRLRNIRIAVLRIH